MSIPRRGLIIIQLDQIKESNEEESFLYLLTNLKQLPNLVYVHR